MTKNNDEYKKNARWKYELHAYRKAKKAKVTMPTYKFMKDKDDEGN